MCRELFFRKFKLKVNSTGIIFGDKITYFGVFWDNIYFFFSLTVLVVFLGY